MRKIQIVVACVVVMFTGTVSASHMLPSTIIASYDINSTYRSGSGRWGHNYNGTIVGGSIANYSRGSGTLNDRFLSSSISSTQLFNTSSNTSPTIILNLNGYYALNSLLIYGGNISRNAIPGRLSGLDITIGTTTQGFSTISQGQGRDDLALFTGTPLNGLVTNQLTLSNFKSTYNSINTFSISEIALAGTRMPPPFTNANPLPNANPRTNIPRHLRHRGIVHGRRCCSSKT